MTLIDPLKLNFVVGARPNYMKSDPLMRAFARESAVAPARVHRGPHYDQALEASFFGQSGICEPDVDLGVGSGSHAVQTVDIMTRFEQELERSDAGPQSRVGSRLFD